MGSNIVEAITKPTLVQIYPCVKNKLTHSLFLNNICEQLLRYTDICPKFNK